MEKCSHKIKLICHNNNIVSSLSQILALLDDNTIKSIEAGNLSLATYAKVFVDSQPFDSGFCQRVNAKLNDANYIIKLETKL